MVRENQFELYTLEVRTFLESEDILSVLGLSESEDLGFIVMVRTEFR